MISRRKPRTSSFSSASQARQGLCLDVPSKLVICLLGKTASFQITQLQNLSRLAVDYPITNSPTNKGRLHRNGNKILVIACLTA
jgi:hypothetical protein